jgi:hypothetical protein
LFIDGQVLIVGVVDLDTDLLLTKLRILPGRSRNIPEKEIAFKHGIDAQTNMME